MRWTASTQLLETAPYMSGPNAGLMHSCRLGCCREGGPSGPGSCVPQASRARSGGRRVAVHLCLAAQPGGTFDRGVGYLGFWGHLLLAAQPGGDLGCSGHERDQQRVVRQRGGPPLAPVLVRHVAAPGQPVGRPEVDRLRAVEACAGLSEQQGVTRCALVWAFQQTEVSS